MSATCQRRKHFDKRLSGGLKSVQLLHTTVYKLFSILKRGKSRSRGRNKLVLEVKPGGEKTVRPRNLKIGKERKNDGQNTSADHNVPDRAEERSKISLREDQPGKRSQTPG